MIRGRLLAHGLLTGVLVGVLAGIADAYTTSHEFLGRSFLGVSILAWTFCGVLAGSGLGLAAALVVDPEQRRRSAPHLAAIVTVSGALFPAWFLILVHVNVNYLAADTGAQALLVDAGSAAVAIAAGLFLVPTLARAFRRRGLAYRLLGTLAGPTLVAAGAFGTAWLAWPGGRPDARPPENLAASDAPNVLLVLVDTLRRDHLSIEGYSRPTSPALDDLARAGTRFSRFTSQSCYTKPAVASLLTSLYPSGHRVGHLRTVLAEDRLTLTEVFHEAGYRTAMFVSNPIVGPEFGFSQGSELFHMLPSELHPKTKLGYAIFRLNEGDRNLVPALALALRRLERAVTGRPGAEVLNLTADEVAEAFRRWRESVGPDPWFAYLHFMEPHAPYAPPAEDGARFASVDEPLRARHPPNAGLFLPFSEGERVSPAETAGLIRAYDAEIAGLDRRLGTLLAEVRAPSPRATIVGVTSDHGEEFYEHRGWGHGHSLHAELLEVPFLLAGPGVPVGATLDHTAQLVDVAPTLLELAGVPVPDTMTGRSLVPLLVLAGAGEPVPDDGESERFAEIVYGEAYWARALTADGWKLIVSRLGDDRRCQLFDVRTDPKETTDLAAERPERVAAMTARIDSLVAAAERGAAPEAHAEFDPATLERLRALGYVEQ